MTSLLYIRYIAIISVCIYFVFNYFDEKMMKDEREELIQLKTHELIHKLLMVTITLCALVFVIQPEMNAFFPIMTTVISAMYGEIFGKLYYRRKF